MKKLIELSLQKAVIVFFIIVFFINYFIFDIISKRI